MGFWGWSSQRGPGAEPEGQGEAESFEAIVHLKEAPKLVKTLMQSKYCAVMIHWSQSWGPQCMVPPISSLGDLCPLAPLPMGGGKLE